MKKVYQLFVKRMERNAVKAVNSPSRLGQYEPKIPGSVKQLKKTATKNPFSNIYHK